MRKRRRFWAGDLVKLRAPEIQPMRKRFYKNSLTGEGVWLRVYSIQGILGQVPFARTLAKKRFLCVKPSKPQGQRGVFVLYDNYKPGILGGGWSLQIMDESLFKRVGRVIDLKKYPRPAQVFVKNDLFEGKMALHSYNKKGLSPKELIRLARSNPVHIFESDPVKKFALMQIAGHHCGNCGEDIVLRGVRVYTLEQVDQDKLMRIICERCETSPENISEVFHALFVCQWCRCSSVLVSFKRWHPGREEPEPLEIINLGDPTGLVLS